MGLLDKTTIPNCKALFRTGEIKTVDEAHRLLDVEINGVLHEDIPVHYHCMDEWKNHAHPHTESEQTQMLAAFKVDDQVLVLCDDDAKPLYVAGFLENPKSCAPTIVLFKQTGEEYDWWFWNLNENVGYHQNPGATLPTSPEIISKWWSCENLEEVEYYTRATPALQTIATGGCIDECGLINFDNGECCDALQGAEDANDAWYVCPCGGVGQGSMYYGTVCKQIVNCAEGCDPGTQELNYAGAKSTQTRTSNQLQPCQQGYSWLTEVGDLVEKIEIGPRSLISGSESKDVATLLDNDCSVQRVLFACMVFNPETCQCTTWYDPQFVGYECNTSCSGWWLHENGYYHKWSFAAHGYGTTYQGCIDYHRVQKNGSYSTLSAPIVTRVAVGEKETVFEGLWSEYQFSGNGAEGDFQHGWTTTCLTCSDSGSLGDNDPWGDYTFAEVSYGIAGWHTITLEDERIAVLIPKLSLAASAISVDGSVIGSISSTTTALLRIVDQEDYDFEIAEEEQGDILLSMPGVREDLGIAPNCYPRENLPYEIQLRGFHWHELYDWVLTAFIMGSAYNAVIAKKIDNVWQLDALTEFRSWVEINGLEDYTAFLN